MCTTRKVKHSETVFQGARAQLQTLRREFGESIRSSVSPQEWAVPCSVSLLCLPWEVQHSQTPEGSREKISQKKHKHLSVGGWDFCVFGNIAFNFIIVWHNMKIVHDMYYVMYYVMKILPRYENFDRFKNMSGYEICQDIKILSRCYGCGRIKKLFLRRLIEHY